jgi:glycosyltransferase involved in cell wall biosynthesis
MRLCIITSSFPLNPTDARAAAGLFVKDFALAVRDLGHRVVVVTPDKTPGEKVEIPGLPVHWYPWRGGDKILATLKPWRPGDALAMASLFKRGIRALDRLVESEGFDHVLAMWAVPAGYLARGVKQRHGIPFSTWCLGSDIWTYARYPVVRGLIRRILLASDHIFADGLQLANDVTRLSGRPCPFLASSRRLDRSLIKPVEVPDEGFKFLFIGRYAKVKGVDVLLEAMATFLKAGGTGTLQLLGGGPLDADVRERVARADLRAHVTVGGFADEATVVSHLDASDCLVIPSRMESIPVVLSDALQMDRPVIVSDVGDMGRLLSEHRAGLVVPPEDSEALASAMLKMAAGGKAGFDPKSLAETFDVRRTAASWCDEVGAR